MNALLTPEQLRAIASAKGEQVRLTDPLTNQDYILVKAETYQRWQNLLAADTVYATAEMVDRIMADDDADDSQLAELQKKYGGTQR